LAGLIGGLAGLLPVPTIPAYGGLPIRRLPVTIQWRILPFAGSPLG
jgi:hypothetical protein